MSGTGEASKRPDMPMFGECVIGYRTWLPDARDQLWPLTERRRPWRPGVNTARCNCGKWNSRRAEWSTYGGRRVLEPAPEHRAPDGDCECGLYSWRRPREHWRDVPSRASPPRVIGAVASWGSLQVHEHGFRAERACVVTLAYHADSQPEALAVLERIARRYWVNLVPLADLEQAASRHGTPLPDTLRPPSVASNEPRVDDPPCNSPPERHAPDDTVEEVGSASPRVGFDGRPLPRPLFESFGPGI